MMNIIATIIMLLMLVVLPVHAAPRHDAGIASAHPRATAAGFEILEAGGNAFDAAVAVSATLAVVEPYSSGLGGGGFWLLQQAGKDEAVMVDGRETAPLKAHEKMYQDEKGQVIPGLSMNGALAAGIPGEPAALVHIAKKYGRLPLSTSLAPAIRAAREGFEVTEFYQRMAKFRLQALRSSKAAAAVFLYRDEIPHQGYVIKQPDLARTLEAIANHGAAGFYQGSVAKNLLAASDKAGGIWTAKDLKGYEVKERRPVTGSWYDYKITSAAPPSSGGIAIIEMLNMLEQDGLRSMQGAARKHLLIEAMRRAYRDRAEFLGDPDFVDVPLKRLTDKVYARELRQTISLSQATPSRNLKPVSPVVEGHHTTHFSILDADGNRVAATLSINYPFGSGFMAAGTGILFNDEMDDFSAKPGVANAYGLVGAQANAIAPGKRMLSSMSPTFIEGPDRLAILGSPGGSRIITMVLHGILAVSEGRSAKYVVSQPRFHHQYLPDVVQFENKAFTVGEVMRLQSMGHRLKQLRQQYGNMQIVILDKARHAVSAASDPRGEGLAQVKKIPEK
ncbi:Gamma-glutamyltranspeptidase @ Glutathione hydrolase [hydrothermal vent metagenome]|uniref:Gamma-glutamyltranspeptidase @ Glutathione hydrolase n=1 Tax=hydrothermal vent metagenome TaxID=652676 RepID=A0A3B1BKD7_9ZZZZ